MWILKLVELHGGAISGLMVLITVFVIYRNVQCKCRQQHCVMNTIFFVNSIRYLIVLYDQYCLSAIPLLSTSSAMCSTAQQVIYATAVSGCNITWVLKTDAETPVVCNSLKYIVQIFSQCIAIYLSDFVVELFTTQLLYFQFWKTKVIIYQRWLFFLHSQLVRTAILRSPFPLF